MTKIPQYLLSLAGEYRICSELNKRGIFATVTYGNRKSVDVYAISDRHERALKIEVKTTQQGNFLTGITQKCLAEDPHAPDFWVLFQIRKQDAGFAERFFVLSHQEICAVQAARNQIYSKKYLAPPWERVRLCFQRRRRARSCGCYTVRGSVVKNRRSPRRSGRGLVIVACPSRKLSCVRANPQCFLPYSLATAGWVR